MLTGNLSAWIVAVLTCLVRKSSIVFCLLLLGPFGAAQADAGEVAAAVDPEQLAPFYAGTYFPPEPRYGMPSFNEVLKAAQDWFVTHLKP